MHTTKIKGYVILAEIYATKEKGYENAVKSSKVLQRI